LRLVLERNPSCGPRPGQSKSEDRSAHRTHNGCVLRFGIALWAQRCGVRLLSGSDSLASSPDCVVCTRHGRFLPRCSADYKSALGFRHHCRGIRFWCTADLRPLIAASPAVGSGKCCTPRHLSRDVAVRNGAASLLLGRSSGVQKASVSRHRDIGIDLAGRRKTQVVSRG